MPQQVCLGLTVIDQFSWYRRVEQTNAGKRALGGRNDVRPHGIGRRIQDIQQCGNSTRKLQQQAHIGVLDNLLLGKPEIQQARVDQLPEAGAEPRRPQRP